MNHDTWFFVIALGLTSVLLFTFLYAAIKENSYSKYVWYVAAILVALVAFFLYIYIFYRDSDDHTGVAINAYYIITLLGIFLVSCVFFDFSPTWLQIGGIVIVTVGLILFTFF